MGMRRDAEIKERQALIGLKPAVGRQAELLRAMSDAAFTLIKVIELEHSGIRDGDGFWSGADGMGGTIGKLVAIIDAYEQEWREEWEDRQRKEGHPVPSTEDFPF